MSAANTRTQWQVIRTCLVPQFSFYRSDYHVESIDGLDTANCWFAEIEWLSMHLGIHGGRFRPGGRS